MDYPLENIVVWEPSTLCLTNILHFTSCDSNTEIFIYLIYKIYEHIYLFHRVKNTGILNPKGGWFYKIIYVTSEYFVPA